jgi:transcriptional regulator with XRE-family HTH domain
MNMSGEILRAARESRGWTQSETGRRLGISQAYIALLEAGRRAWTPGLTRKTVKVFKLNPVFLPTIGRDLRDFTNDELVF